MITSTRKIEFDAAHRIMNHEGKCKYLHGHRYILEVTFSTNHLDNLGRVIDFGIIKDRIKKWIDENIDHNTILCIEDENLGKNISKITSQNIYYMNNNPTSENIAKHLHEEIIPKLFEDFTEVKILKTKLYETPNCFSSIY